MWAPELLSHWEPLEQVSREVVKRPELEREVVRMTQTWRAESVTKADTGAPAADTLHPGVVLSGDGMTCPLLPRHRSRLVWMPIPCPPLPIPLVPAEGSP